MLPGALTLTGRVRFSPSDVHMCIRTIATRCSSHACALFCAHVRTCHRLSTLR